jgi:hypothetical protein
MTASAWALSYPFQGVESQLTNLNFTAYAQKTPARKLKIAVLDSGFYGVQNEIGKTLPASTVYIPGPLAAPADLKNDHGLHMAQILVDFMTQNGKAPQFTPELYLYNVFGFTNFQAAVSDLVNKHVDLVLYSEVWQYGGNNDGTGFINAEVSRATDAGVVWVNAAGNFATSTYNTFIQTTEENWVVLPNENRALKVICPANPQNKCNWKIVLSWNDFKDDVNLGTSKDLDLALTDDLLNIVQSSSLKQSKDPNESRPGFSKYPREIIETSVKPGVYLLRVKDQSQNFSSRDQLRITVDGDFVVMPTHDVTENLLNPADNDSVVTVGASDSDRSSVSESLNKPDLFAPSSLLFTGNEYRGSSNSAAIVAAGFGVLKSLNADLSKEDLIRQTRGAPRLWLASDLTTSQLGFRPTGNCFQPLMLQNLPKHLQAVLDRGGVFVQTTAGVRILFPNDPLALTSGLQRSFVTDVVLATAQGYKVIPRNSAYNDPTAAEVFQRPIDATICSVPLGLSKFFALPNAH